MTIINIRNSILSPLDSLATLNGVAITIYYPNQVPNDIELSGNNAYLIADITLSNSVPESIDGRSLIRREGSLNIAVYTELNAGSAVSDNVMSGLIEIYDSREDVNNDVYMSLGNMIPFDNEKNFIRTYTNTFRHYETLV